MNKKLFFAALMLLIGLMPKTWAYDFSSLSPSGDTLYYIINGANVTVTSPYSGSAWDWNPYTEPSGALVIPSSVNYNGNTYTVTAIGDYAFYECSKITSVTIPEGVTTIGRYAFYANEALTSIQLPNSLISIGMRAFASTGLTSITLPDGVTTIDQEAFMWCSNLKTLVVGKSLETIGYQAFHSAFVTNLVYNCPADMPAAIKEKTLESVTIGDDVTVIGIEAFKDCKQLTTLIVGKSVESVGTNAFSGVQLRTLEYNCPANIPYYAANEYLVSATIGDAVTSIGGQAFSGCTRLQSVTMGKSVSTIEYRAFYNCTSLTSITWSDALTSIGEYAFYGCSKLSSLILPDALTTLGYQAFASCSSLQTLVVGKSLTNIDNSFFNDNIRTLEYNCPANIPLYVKNANLTTVIVGDDVTSIGYQAFNGCSGLKTVTIGKSVTTIDSYAFHGCSSLQSISLSDGITTIGGYAFKDCIRLTSITLPKSLTIINPFLFYGCSSLSSVQLNDNITSIGGNAFCNCTDLTSITLPEPIATISGSAFYGCSKLSSVKFPKTLKEIGTYAFYGCSKLRTINLPDSVNFVSAYAFQNCTRLDTLIIGTVGGFGNGPFDGADAIKYLSYNSNAFQVGNIPKTYLNTVIIGDAITAINNSYQTTALHSLTIGSGVTSISAYAFSNSTGLSEVHYTGTPEQWLAIKMENDYSNPILMSRNLYIGDEMLTQLVIPEGIETLNQNFRGDTALAQVYIPATVTQIKENAFKDCNLKETHYNGTVEQWLAIKMENEYSNPIYCSHNLYLGDSLVKVLRIPEGVTAINNNFRNDAALDYIYIPSTVTNIAGYAFNGCAPAWFIFKPATPPTLDNSNAFLYTLDGKTYGSWMMVPWKSLDAYKGANNYATFAANLIYPDSCQLTVKINDVTRGTVLLDGGEVLTKVYPLLDTATLVITPAEHYQPVVQVGGCTNLSQEGETTVKLRFNMSNANPTAQVNFIGNLHHVNVVANGAYGTVSGTKDYHYGDMVTVKATPAAGYYFARWADGSRDNPATFICTGDTTVKAIFSDDVTPELCMVSVQKDHNMLLWDKAELPIVSYTVYREGNIAGEYEAIATIPYAGAGMYTDTTSRPSSRSYRYRLTATDTCGIESQPGGIHKTMFLAINQGVGNGKNLLWSEYEGAEYTTYIIYRGTNASNVQQIDIMPSGGNTGYADNNAPAGEVFYQVGVLMTTPCDVPTKSSTKSSTISLSNIASSEGTGIKDLDDSNIRISVQNGNIVVEGADGEMVRIFDLTGRQVKNHSLSNGVYLVKIGDRIAKKVMVQNQF